MWITVFNLIFLLSHSIIFTFYYSLSFCIRIVTTFNITSFLIVFSLLILQYHKVLLTCKMSSRLLSYYFHKHCTKTECRDGNTFMSCEFHTVIFVIQDNDPSQKSTCCLKRQSSAPYSYLMLRI